MMICSRATTLLQYYVDGRLDPRHLSALEDHLRDCASCSQHFAWLEQLQIACAESESVNVPQDLTTRVMAYIAHVEARQASFSSRAFSLGWGDGALAALLASVSTLVFVLLDPNLRDLMGLVIFHALPGFLAFLMRPGPGSFAWLAWIVWVMVGVGLTLTVAGSEVRFLWRRSLASRLSQFPQLPQLR